MFQITPQLFITRGEEGGKGKGTKQGIWKGGGAEEGGRSDKKIVNYFYQNLCLNLTTDSFVLNWFHLQYFHHYQSIWTIYLSNNLKVF